MNKKAQSFGTGIAIIAAITIFIIGMTAHNFMKDEVTNARSASALNCANPTSDGVKLTCLAVDSVVPYFIITIFAVSIGLVVGRALK